MSSMTMLCLLPCAAQKQHGKASYYSKKATGARTASGQRLHHDSLVCAHRFYPFGTRLKVTNLNNNKSVIVKVIDRGPFGRGRIIDLSWGAAKAIGMLSQGVATVKVELQDNPIPYRPEDAKLPRIDFEVAEADYQFGQKWKTDGKDKTSHVTNKDIHMTNKKSINENEKLTQHHEEQKNSDNNKNRHKYQEGKGQKEHDNTPRNNKEKINANSKDKPKSKDSEGGIFDKIKNWGSDLF